MTIPDYRNNSPLPFVSSMTRYCPVLLLPCPKYKGLILAKLRWKATCRVGFGFRRSVRRQALKTGNPYPYLKQYPLDPAYPIPTSIECSSIPTRTAHFRESPACRVTRSSTRPGYLQPALDVLEARFRVKIYRDSKWLADHTDYPTLDLP